MRTMATITALAVIAVLTPTNVELQNTGPAVRLSEVCGQATSCIKDPEYICSTFHQDHIGYNCYTGCPEEEQE